MCVPSRRRSSSYVLDVAARYPGEGGGLQLPGCSRRSKSRPWATARRGEFSDDAETPGVQCAVVVPEVIGCDVTYLRRPRRPPLQVGTEADRNRCLRHAALSGSGCFRRYRTADRHRPRRGQCCTENASGLQGFSQLKARIYPCCKDLFFRRVDCRGAPAPSTGFGGRSDGPRSLPTRVRRRRPGKLGGFARELAPVPEPPPPLPDTTGPRGPGWGPVPEHRPARRLRDGDPGYLTAKTTPYQRITGHRLTNRPPVRTHSRAVARAVCRGRGD